MAYLTTLIDTDTEKHVQVFSELGGILDDLRMEIEENFNDGFSVVVYDDHNYFKDKEFTCKEAAIKWGKSQFTKLCKLSA